MRDGTRAGAAARAFLTLGALLPYWRLLTFSVVYVPDDYFASDVFNGELPARAIAGRLLAHAQLPLWTNQICSGFPLVGFPADPIGLAAFALLPPAAALDLLVVILLLVAAHGAYGLARRFGADRTGAVLAGLAFAGSGYLACQLRHLSIVSTVVWLPVGLLLTDRALAAPDEAPPPSFARRMVYVALLGLVYADQVLAGFPQSAYICGLVYGSFAVFRVLLDRGRLVGARRSASLLAATVTALALGAVAGAVVLLPLSELGSVSDRAASLGWKWAIYISYWPPNVLTFLVPYINGDFGNATYIGPPIFWEDYAYIGAAPFLLALYAALRERRRPLVAFAAGMTILAFLLAVGRRTPVFHAAYVLIPGMNLFRAPTRFLVVVDLGLAILGAIGLTHLRAQMERRWGPGSPAPRLIAVAVCVLTAIDLFIYQPRQDPMVPARDWLAPPPAAGVILADTAAPRSFTPRHRDVHRRAELAAHGWADVRPLFEVRDILEPNSGGGLWNVPSADCYAGISPRWHVDVWSDHSRETSLMSELAYHDFDAHVLVMKPPFVNLLRSYGVTHFVSPYPARDASLPPLQTGSRGYVYKVPDAARVRFVRAARRVATEQEAAARMIDPRFDPDREVLLLGAPDAVHPTVEEASLIDAAGSASISGEDGRGISVDVTAPEDGFLLLADTFYPGWSATVDGAATPIYRANISVRAIAVPRGRHAVHFTFDAPRFFRGLRLSIAALAALLLWTGAAVYAAGRTAARAGAGPT